MANLPDKLLTSKSPALPLGPTEYSRQYQDQLNSILRLYFGQIDNVLGSLTGPNGGRFVEVPNGLFFNTEDQTFASPNVAYSVTYNATYLSNAVTLQSGSTSKIEVSISGIYNFQYSGQLLSTNASSKDVYLWIKRNGINIGYSTHAYTLSSNNEYTEINWNFLLANLSFSAKSGSLARRALNLSFRRLSFSFFFSRSLYGMATPKTYPCHRLYQRAGDYWLRYEGS